MFTQRVTAAGRKTLSVTRIGTENPDCPEPQADDFGRDGCG
ncbi:hypothetical protein [Halovenus halobia]